MESVKFVIASPRQNCGGPIVLHLLCKILMEKGYDAKIFYFARISNKKSSSMHFWRRWFSFLVRDSIKLILVKLFPNASFVKKRRYAGYNYYPVKGCRRKYLPFIDKSTIVVYPEICRENFLNAKKVVRWLLYFNRFAESADVYGKDDLFFCYREIFNDKNLNSTGKKLYLCNFDYDLYKQTNFESRSGNCYIIRKGKDRTDLPTQFDGPIIDNLPEREIVEIFNKCKYCFCYDTQTFYASIAAVCGCIPIVIPELGKKRNDYIGKDDKVYGIAYGNDEVEIEYAKRTRGKLVEEINGYRKMNSDNVEIFLNECKKKFCF